MKKLNIADRLNDIEPFRVVEVLTRAKALAAQGHSIIHMEAGEPDFATAEPIIKAGQEALARGETYYSQAVGIPELRAAISTFYQTEYGLEVPANRILVTPGASGALLLTAGLLMNPGENMLMADPGYPCNRHFLRLVEGEGKLVPVTAQDRYQLLAAKAEQHWDKQSKGVMVASPANPTGEILMGQELQDLAMLCEQQQGHLVVDEIYHGLHYDSDVHSVLEYTDQAFVINSFSKYFGMTGWRLGWMVAPEWAVPHLEKLAQNLFISMSTFGQYAALSCFEPETRRILDGRREQFKQRRDFLLPELRNLGFDIPSTPAGALYLYAGIDKFSDDCQAFCMEMLEEYGVALTPGVDFGHFCSNQYVRFAYTTSMEKLEEGVERLTKVLK